jgi:hypothetical protein
LSNNNTPPLPAKTPTVIVVSMKIMTSSPGTPLGMVDSQQKLDQNQNPQDIYIYNYIYISNWMLMWWSPMWWWNPAGKFQEISQNFLKMQSLTYFFFAWTFFFGRMNNLLRSEVSSCQGDLCKDSPPGWLCNSQGRAQFWGFM